MRVNFVLPLFLHEPVGGYKVIYDHANFLVSRGHKVRIIFPRLPTAEPFGVFGQLRGWAWALRRRYRHRPLITWHPLDKRIQLRLAPNLNAKNIPDADITIATAWNTAEPVSQAPSRKGAKFYFIQ